MSNGKNSKNPKPYKTFSVDAEKTGTRIPSITKLLNRKSLQTQKKREEAARPAAKAPVASDIQEPAPIDAPKTENRSPDLNTASSISAAPAAPVAPAAAEFTKSEIIWDDNRSMIIQIERSPASKDLKIVHNHSLQNSTGQIHISKPEAQPEKPAPAATPKTAGIRPAARRDQKAKSAEPELINWDLKELNSSKDPLATVLVALFKKSAQSGLFLAVSPPAPGMKVPLFKASAAVQSRAYQALWSGLKWDPSVTPEAWNHFVRSGVVELSPPGTMTNIASQRNVIRGAFGVEQNEWLTLLRAGPISACRGVLAIVSKQSIMNEIRPLLELLSQAGVPGNAA